MPIKIPRRYEDVNFSISNNDDDTINEDIGNIRKLQYDGKISADECSRMVAERRNVRWELDAELEDSKKYYGKDGFELPDSRYEFLLDMKKRAYSEADFKILEKEFRDMFRNMNGYKDTNILADECEKIYRSKKKAREDQEKIEDERRRNDEKERKSKAEQSKLWRESGLCQYCGGNLSFYTYSYGRKCALWNDYGGRKCKVCKKENDADKNRAKVIRGLFVAGEVVVAVLAALMINIFTLIPFAIVFLYSPYGRGITGVNEPNMGFRKFIRVTSIIAQIIVALSVISVTDGSFISILSSIMLVSACIMAYKLPLKDGSWW